MFSSKHIVPVMSAAAVAGAMYNYSRQGDLYARLEELTVRVQTLEAALRHLGPAAAHTRTGGAPPSAVLSGPPRPESPAPPPESPPRPESPAPPPESPPRPESPAPPPVGRPHTGAPQKEPAPIAFTVVSTRADAPPARPSRIAAAISEMPWASLMASSVNPEEVESDASPVARRGPEVFVAERSPSPVAPILAEPPQTSHNPAPSPAKRQLEDLRVPLGDLSRFALPTPAPKRRRAAPKKRGD